VGKRLKSRRQCTCFPWGELEIRGIGHKATGEEPTRGRVKPTEEEKRGKEKKGRGDIGQLSVEGNG